MKQFKEFLEIQDDIKNPGFLQRNFGSSEAAHMEMVEFRKANPEFAKQLREYKLQKAAEQGMGTNTSGISS